MRCPRTWLIAALLLAEAGHSLAAGSDVPAGTPDFAPAKPARGWIAVGFQAVHTEGSYDDVGDDAPFLRNLQTDTRSMTLSIDYRLGPRWSVSASLPFIRKRAVNDAGAHNPANLAEPREDSQFLDDGQYHGTWQDWQLGLAHHSTLAGFDIRSHAVLTWPSRDYTFFASAAAGQRLKRLRLGFDASRRWAHSNFHYSAGYSYELVERVLGYNLNRHHLRLSGRYDFSPHWSANLFVSARDGRGPDPGMFFREAQLGSELWYQHDRLLRQNYGFAGIGGSWRFSETWAISASTSRMLWGENLHRTRYAYDVQLGRSF